MRQDVIVRVAGGDEYTLQASAPMTLDAARRWLDHEFVRLDCVPARASGKVLFADKLLAIAQAADGAGFADATWAAQYANAAAGALAKPLVRIDVDSATVGF